MEIKVESWEIVNALQKGLREYENLSDNITEALHGLCCSLGPLVTIGEAHFIVDVLNGVMFADPKVDNLPWLLSVELLEAEDAARRFDVDHQAFAQRVAQMSPLEAFLLRSSVDM